MLAKNFLEVETCALWHVAVLTNGEPKPEILDSVCVCTVASYHTSCHTILLIFGQKLDIDILRPVTRPDFW